MEQNSEAERMHILICALEQAGSGEQTTKKARIKAEDTLQTMIADFHINFSALQLFLKFMGNNRENENQ